MKSEPTRAICPAKINLALRVLDRRADGYHELDTVFQAIDLNDRIDIEPARELTLRCDAPGIPADRSNLVLRAADLLRERAGVEAGARLVLTKAIPARAGLGGGSSDAAGALRLCARFWDLRVSEDDLVALGRELGADVPFFLVGGTAHGLGRGDRIRPLPFVGAFPVLVGIPPFGLSTREVFRRASTRLTLPGNGVSLPVFSAHKWPEGKDFRFTGNDLERIVFKDWPRLREFRDALLDVGAGVALLSGSGSAVYGIFDPSVEMSGIAKQLRDRFDDWRLIATRSVDRGVRVE